MPLTTTFVLKDETKMAAKALDGIRKLFSQMNFNNVAMIGSRHCLKLDFLTNRTQWEILFSLLETLHMVQLRGGAQVEHVRGRTHDVHSLALNSLDNWSIHRFTRALSDITKTLYQGDGSRCCHTHTFSAWCLEKFSDAFPFLIALTIYLTFYTRFYFFY